MGACASDASPAPSCQRYRCCDRQSDTDVQARDEGPLKIGDEPVIRPPPAPAVTRQADTAGHGPFTESHVQPAHGAFTELQEKKLEDESSAIPLSEAKIAAAVGPVEAPQQTPTEERQHEEGDAAIAAMGNSPTRVAHVRARLRSVEFDDTCKMSDAGSEKTFDGSEVPDSRSVCSDDRASVCSARTTKKRRRRSLSVVETMGLIPSSALQVIIDNPLKIENVYQLSAKCLGQGSFGKVFKGKVKATNALRAIKSISKSHMKEKVALLKEEITIMKMVDHPNIIMLNEIFEDADHMYLVMELCNGGHLQGRIGRAGVSGSDAAIAMQQLLRGVFYLHKKSICHRDLKPENCLLAENVPLSKNQLKVSDFGVSCVMTEPDQVLKSKSGTPSYMAPEVYARSYSKSCDLWSCGVILYELLSGSLPFKAPNDEALASKISDSRLTFTDPSWVKASQDALDLVGSLIVKNPAARYTVEQALNHEFIVSRVPKSKAPKLAVSMLRNLKIFRKLNVFKRAVLQIVASMLSEEDVGEYRRIFVSLDKDGDGDLSFFELAERLKKDDQKVISDVQGVFKDAEQQEGKLRPFTYTEFLAASFDRQKCLTKDVLWAAFQNFDKNGDGRINMAELAQGRLMGNLSMEDLWQTFQDLDSNGDTEIDFEEFTKMMLEGNH